MCKFLPILLLLTSCTCRVNMVNTDGRTSDIVDENQTASPDISPTFKIPLSGATSPSIYQPNPHGMNGPDRQFI